MSSVLKINKNDDFLMASFLDNFQKLCSGGGTATISESHKWRKIKIVEFNYFYRPIWATWKCVCAKRQETIWFGAHATFEKFTSRSSLQKSCSGSKKRGYQIGASQIPLDQWSFLAFEVAVRRLTASKTDREKMTKSCSRIGFLCNCWHGDHPEIHSEVE